MEFKDRLQELIDYKRINGKKVTPYAIGRDTIVSKTSVLDYLNKGSMPSPDRAKALADYFGVSVEWLLYGEEPEKEESNAVPSIVEFMEFPLVRQCAYAGYLSGYADNDYVESLPTATFVVDHIPHGNYISFDVKGDSMDDGTDESYKEGDRVLCREVQMHLWAESKLHFKDWDFVIVHKEGVLIKRIIDHDVENKTITIHSLNPIYEDRILSLCDVRQILNVVQQMRRRKR